MKIPGKLSGTSPLVSWLNELRAAILTLEIRPGVGYRAKQSSEGTILEAFGGGSGGGKWRWHPGVKEHNPATAYKADEVVFISPDNAALVATGIVDLVSNTLTRTPPGTWIAIKDVPAQVTIAAHDAVPETIKYNVPKLLPTTGANLLDASTVYWHLIQEHNPCVGS